MIDILNVPLTRRTVVASMATFVAASVKTVAAAANVTVTLKMIACDRDSGTGGVHLLVFQNFPIRNPDDIKLRDNAPERQNINLPDFKPDHHEVPFNIVLLSGQAIGKKTIVVEMWDRGAVRPLQNNAPHLVGQIFFDLQGGRVADRAGASATGPYHDNRHPSWPSYRFSGGGSSYKFSFTVQQGSR